MYAVWLLVRLVVRPTSGRRDVVIAGRASVEGASACIISALRGWRTIVYLAGGSQHGPEFVNQRRHWVRWLIDRYADEVVGHTSDAFTDLPEGLPRRLIPVIVGPGPPACCYAPSWAPEQLRVVWCARNHPVKDPGRLKRIADGRFSKEGMATLAVTDDASGFEGSVIEVHVGCPNPRSHFADADVAVLTSLYEAQPNVLAEAAMEGCPFVGFDVGGLRESVAALGAGDVVDPGDDEAFVTAVARVAALFRNGRARADLAERARQRHLEAPGHAWGQAVLGDLH